MKWRQATLCDTVKTCYEATHGEDSAFENTCSACGNSSLLLNNALLALGKVPGPEAESASREDASFSRVFWRRSVLQSWTREGRFVEAKLCKLTSWLCSTQRGLLSLCPPLFFKSSKVNSQCQNSFELKYVCFAERSMLATWFKDGGEGAYRKAEIRNPEPEPETETETEPDFKLRPG